LRPAGDVAPIGLHAATGEVRAVTIQALSIIADSLDELPWPRMPERQTGCVWQREKRRKG